MAKKKEAPAAVVLAPFRDKNNFDLAYTEGQDVSHLPEDRLSELVAAGLVRVDAEGTVTNAGDSKKEENKEKPGA